MVSLWKGNVEKHSRTISGHRIEELEASRAVAVNL